MIAPARSRVLQVTAALALGLALLFPLWRVSLTAPQYPEGLGMYIWAHTITGVEPSDLQNINGLNHYIGMQTIEPESIPELQLIRPGIIVMMMLGLAAAAVGRMRWIRTWCVVLLLAAVVGIADFWRWEYDYGHTLDLENAPIQIPGMSYQPPLIGSKKLLNFTATSWPAKGGMLAILSVMLGTAAALSANVKPGGARVEHARTDA